MNNKIKTITAVLAAAAVLCSCGKKQPVEETSSNNSTNIASVNYDPAAPVIEFTARTESEDGTPEYYLFDDNPEHLNSKFLADGDAPSAIAHFEDLTPGIYTVFSYHHRGYSVDVNTDLYYDAAFSSSDGGKVRILKVGLDHDWDWNQAWADYENTSVLIPEYLRTYDCTCGDECECMTENGTCINDDCPAIIRDERRDPKTDEFDNLNVETSVGEELPTLLSEFISYLGDEEINKFRTGDYQDPMWMMLKFEVTEGTVTFDTLAYSDKDTMLENFPTLLPGAFDNEAQYKGIAQNAPEVTTEFSYTITDDTPAGAVPVTVKNMRVPDGYTIPDGVFATNVNTWKEKQPIAAESDIMLLEYKDDTKLDLYGEDIDDADNIWRFDPFHTKVYADDYTSSEEKILKGFNIALGDDFVPNGEMSEIAYPTGYEESSDEFYKYAACNLGNFGVTNRYVIHLSNEGSEDRTFEFDMKSIAGQVYRYSQTDENGKTITDDGGYYYMKKFDDDPAEDPESTTEPKERLAAAEYSSVVSFDAAAGEESTIIIEITTLTGCTAPMHNVMRIM